MNNGRLLLEIGMPFRRSAGGLMVEAQALNGMRLWAEHFDLVTVCATELPADMPDASSVVWCDASPLLATGRVRFEPLPWGYHPRDHFAFRADVKRRLASLVADHEYLCFSNLGAFGAWGNLAVSAAREQGRAFSLWFDWVLHDMPAAKPTRLSGLVKDTIMSRLIKYRTSSAIRASRLGLFHGKTVYDAYSPLCRQPELVHDIHVGPGDAISESELRAKIADQASRSTLKIGYVGRVHSMKAPLQWIDAIAEAITTLGTGRIQATWLGDGPILPEARARVRELQLEDSIVFRGFVSDRAEVLRFLREQDVLGFCHVTPESPRCLLESLISGTPIVGYESAYARELVGDRGGAELTPVHRPSLMASALIRIANDRDRLSSLTSEAGRSRAIYNDRAVFAHRSNLIKRYLKQEVSNVAALSA